MTGLAVHQCPKCELRFSFRTELEYHLRVDHPVQADVEPAAVKVDEAPARDALLAAPPVAPSLALARRGGARWQRRLAASLLAIVVMLLAAYVAVVVSISAAIVIAAVVLVLVGVYVRHSRGWARLPRR